VEVRAEVRVRGRASIRAVTRRIRTRAAAGVEVRVRARGY